MNMALENILYFNSQKEIAYVKSWLIQNMDYIQDNKETEYLIKQGLIASLSKNEPSSNRVDSYGLLSNLCLYFRLDKFEEFEQGYRNMIETIMWILEYLSTEAILYDSGGSIKLLFKDAQLILQKDSWHEQNLSLINLPFIIQEIEEL
jgi:hypothetical protein